MYLFKILIELVILEESSYFENDAIDRTRSLILMVYFLQLKLLDSKQLNVKGILIFFNFQSKFLKTYWSVDLIN